MGNAPELRSRFFQVWRSPWMYFLGLSIVKLWLVGHLPIRASYAGYDNLRYVILANNFLEPAVTYDAFTLVRQPGYPAFIVFSYLLGIPLRFSQEIVYLATGFILAYSSSKYYFRKPIVFIFSTLYIWAPFSFHWNRQTLADVLYLPLVAWIVACLMQCLNSQRDRDLWVGSGSLGLGLAWFWNTRLEGIWIVPAIALTYGILAVKALRSKPQRDRAIFYVRKIAIATFLTIVPVVLLTSGISFLNETRYGIFDTNDLKSPGFEEAYSSLEKVSSSTWQPKVEISRSMRERVYAVSPSFRQLQPYIEAQNHWRTSSCESGICNDYAAGLFYWVLRESVVQAGYYRSAPKTEEFYRQIAREVNRACQAKTLICDSDKTLAFLPDFKFNYIPLWTKSLAKLSQSFLKSTLILKLDSGEEDRQLRQQYYARITREPADFMDERSRVVNRIKDRIILALGSLYQAGFAVILGLSTLGFILETIALIGTKFQRRSLSLTCLGLLLSCILIRLVLIAYIDVTSWSVEAGDRYLRPVLPLLWLILCIGLTCFWQHFDRYRRRSPRSRTSNN